MGLLNMNQINSRKIFLDLDGVFAAFDLYIDTYYPHIRGKSDAEFWAVLSEVPNIFSRLELIRESIAIIEALIANKHDMEFLTAIPYPTKFLCTAANDKREWIATRISDKIPVSTVSGGVNKSQWLHVYPGAVLIDDYQRNITMWNEAGGVGILHTSADSTLAKLKELKLI